MRSIVSRFSQRRKAQQRIKSAPSAPDAACRSLIYPLRRRFSPADARVGRAGERLRGSFRTRSGWKRRVKNLDYTLSSP